MKTNHLYILALIVPALFFILPAKQAEAGSNTRFVSYTGKCSGSMAQRVKSSAKMQRALRRLSELAGNRTINAYSCTRSASRQAQLYRQMGGNPQRVGRPNGSQHVVGVAADLKKWADKSAQCQMMDRVRAEVMGGVGGVATYSGGDAHLDARNTRAQWNHCRRILGNGSNAYRSSTVERYRQRRQSPVANIPLPPRRPASISPAAVPLPPRRPASISPAHVPLPPKRPKDI